MISWTPYMQGKSGHKLLCYSNTCGISYPLLVIHQMQSHHTPSLPLPLTPPSLPASSPVIPSLLHSTLYPSLPPSTLYPAPPSLPDSTPYPLPPSLNLNPIHVYPYSTPSFTLPLTPP